MKQFKKDKKTRAAQEDALYGAVLKLKTAEECRRFFTDLCTPAEIEAMADRWQVVGMLMQKIPYRTIAAQTGVSVVTIGRVARSLHGEKEGYRLALERLGEWNDD